MQRFRIPKPHLKNLCPCSYLIILISIYVLVLNTMLNITQNYQERVSPARFLFFVVAEKNINQNNVTLNSKNILSIKYQKAILSLEMFKNKYTF